MGIGFGDGTGDRIRPVMVLQLVAIEVWILLSELGDEGPNVRLRQELGEPYEHSHVTSLELLLYAEDAFHPV